MPYHESADEYMENISENRRKRRRRRPWWMDEGEPPHVRAKPGPHGGEHGSATLRHPRRKKGKYLAA